MLLPDVAEQLLQDVLQRDDADLLAELVHHQRDVDLPPLELPQQEGQLLGGRDDEGGPHEIPPLRGFPPCGHRPETLLEVENPDDVASLPRVHPRGILA